MRTLIIARAVAGMGGGGYVSFLRLIMRVLFPETDDD
jgi:hypothetical protein